MYVLWKSLDDQSIFVIHGGPLIHTWAYAKELPQDGTRYAREINHVIRRPGLWTLWQPPDLPTSRDRKEPGIYGVQLWSQWFNQSCLHNETPIKSLDMEASQGSFLALNTLFGGGGGGDSPNCMRQDTEALCLGPSRPCLMWFVTWLVLICILFNNYTCMYSTFLGSLYRSNELSNLRGSWESPKLVAGWSEVQVTTLAAGIWNEDSWGPCP